ncbi:TPA: hypothetical protein ACF3RY_007027, partial [Pseudomonas aeruginosa]
CRFFENDELEAIEELSGTKLLVEYHMDRHSMVPATKVEPENLDTVELFEIRMNLGAMQGALSVLIQNSISDGVLTDEEIKAIDRKLAKVFGYAAGFIESLKTVYGIKP